MKDQELELQVAPMSNDTMEYLNVLFGVCKRFKTDYYHATPNCIVCYWTATKLSRKSLSARRGS